MLRWRGRGGFSDCGWPVASFPLPSCPVSSSWFVLASFLPVQQPERWPDNAGVQPIQASNNWFSKRGLCVMAWRRLCPPPMFPLATDCQPPGGRRSSSTPSSRRSGGSPCRCPAAPRPPPPPAGASPRRRPARRCSARATPHPSVAPNAVLTSCPSGGRAR